MATLKIYDNAGNLTSTTIPVDDRIFTADGGEHLIYEAVTFHLGNRRQGTAKTKERSEVKASRRKPWRQKGTGRARVGAVSSPIWRGGGTTFGPSPRDYTRKLPAKAARKARISALSAKYRDESIFATEALRLEEPKTRVVAGLLETMNLSDKKVLWLVSESNRNARLAARNLARCRTLLATNVSVYDIINSDVVLIEKDAVGPLQEILIP
ncbi:50S ribosomal protein L4 [Gemmatimonadota bacterium]